MKKVYLIIIAFAISMLGKAQTQFCAIGSYNLIKNVGAKYGLRLYNDKVPESRAILIHIGNYPKDTEGCLLPGKTKGVDFVESSGPLINEIMNHFSQYSFKGKIIISENYE
jgi:hypothetical protein